MRQWLVGIGVVACLIAGIRSRLMAADPPGHSDRNDGRARIYVHAGITPFPGKDPSDRELLLNDLISDTVTLWPVNQIDAITIEAAREYLIAKNPRVLFIGLGVCNDS